MARSQSAARPPSMSPTAASGWARPMKHVPAGMPEAPAVPGRLLAVSDLHVSHPRNRKWVADLPPGSPGDWLLVAGDLAEKVEDIEWTLRTLRSCYGTVVWVPGNHDLWAHPRDPVKLRGEARYQHLVALCRDLGVITPGGPLPGVDRRRRPGGDRPAVPALRLHVPPGRHQHQGRGAGPGLPDRRGRRRRAASCTPTRTRAGRPGARPASTRPCRGWRPSTRICRRSWSATSRSPESPLGSCAIRCSRSGAAPSRPRTGTGASAPSRWSTATCTSRGRCFQDGVRFEEVSLGYPYEQDRHPETPAPADPDPAARPCQDSRATTRRW